MRLWSRCRHGLESSEGLPGARGPTSKLVRLHGHWQKAQILYHMHLFIRVLEYLQGMAASFSQGRQMGRESMDLRQSQHLC